jgi:hypothetical protein
MSLPLILKSKLFWLYNGVLDGSWYLPYQSVAKQDAYIRDMDRFGTNVVALNICNEGIGTPYSGEFMNSSLHEGRCNSLVNFMSRLNNAGKMAVPVYFDCPPMENPKYPIWKFRNRIPGFLQMATTALCPAKNVVGIVFAIESSRGPNADELKRGVPPGLTIEEVDACVEYIQRFAWRTTADGQVNKVFVGTHEASYRIAPHADFIGYETRNHPVDQGDSTSVADMVRDVQGLIARAGGKPIWVMESNSSEGAQAKAQNRALAALPGVVGVNCPM